MYDPKSIDRSSTGGKWAPQAGVYRFEIVEATELTFKTGNAGIKIRFDVDAGGKYACKAWENFTWLPAALWKFEALCHSIGIPFDPAPQAHQIVGLTGDAQWDTEQRGEYTDLVLAEFLARPDEPAPLGSVTDWNAEPEPPRPQPAELPNWSADDDDGVPF